MDDLARTMRAARAQRRAFVSFLLGAGDYVKGVVALAKSLRAVRSAYPLVVAVTECVPLAHRKLLAREGCAVREIEKVAPPGGFKGALDYYAVNYSKLRIWQVGQRAFESFFVMCRVVCDSFELSLRLLMNVTGSGVPCQS